MNTELIAKSVQMEMASMSLTPIYAMDGMDFSELMYQGPRHTTRDL